MNRKTIEPTTLFVAAALLLFAVIGTYVAGYFGLSELRPTTRSGTTLRVFPNEVLAKSYYPASALEQRLTGKKVLLGCYPN